MLEMIAVRFINIVTSRQWVGSSSSAAPAARIGWRVKGGLTSEKKVRSYYFFFFNLFLLLLFLCVRVYACPLVSSVYLSCLFLLDAPASNIKGRAEDFDSARGLRALLLLHNRDADVAVYRKW